VKRFYTFIAVFLVLIAAAIGYFNFDYLRTGPQPDAEGEDAGENPVVAARKDHRPELEKKNSDDAAKVAPAGNAEAERKTETDVAARTDAPANEAVTSARENPPADSASAPPSSPVPQETSAPITPSFDVVRVESGGSTLIAGQGAPNAKILIEKNGEVIAETTTDAAGSFVALPTDSITGDNNQVVIRSIAGDGSEKVSDQVVAIGVPAQGEPLVAIVEPGKAVEIIQKPQASQSVAEAAPAPTSESVKNDAPTAASPKQEETVVARLEPSPVARPQPSATDPLAQTNVPSADNQTQQSENNAAEKSDAATGAAEAAEETRRVARLLSPSQATDPLAVKPEASTPLDANKAQSPSGLVQEEQPASVSENGLRADDTPEDQGGEAAPGDNADRQNGGAPDSTLIQPSLADNRAASGEREKVDAGEVIARASEPQPEPEPEVTRAPTVEIPSISVEAVEVDGDKIFIAGASKAGATIRIYINGEDVGDVKTASNGRWLYEDRKHLDAGRYTIRVDQIAAVSGSVDARAEVPFVVEERTISEIANAESNTIIIRRDDNLWTIAKRLYGDGLRYTAIYEQNRDQIRDPDLIFPGQTFTLPREGRKNPVEN